MQPFFSVIIPTYNRAQLLALAVNSVLNQSFTGWELIIIDDGSTDNTRQVMEGYTDTRIRYNWQTNQERSRARNNGIKLAQGKFICFLDSDDIWRDNHLEVLHAAIIKNDSREAFYFTGMCWNFPGRKQDVIFESPVNKNPVEYVIKNQIAPATACFHAAIRSKYQFNPDLRINEDVELFARIVAEYPLIQIPVVTVDFIIHEQNTRAQEGNYINTELRVMDLIFHYPDLKNRISSSFKRERYRSLYHQLINYLYASGEYGRMNVEIIRFLINYPGDIQNKSRIVLLLYHLPGGKLLQRVVQAIKSKK